MVRIHDEVKEQYLSFLYEIVIDDNHKNYWSLIGKLHSIPFTVLLERDSNRYEDGVNLRLYFCRTFKYEDEVAINDLGGECSILEMLVALAIRIEKDIMWDPDLGDRTSVWFWKMIDNLGLSSCTDEEFDEECEEIIDHYVDTFVGRSYFRDGFGGLFPLKNPREDQRKVEIWYQMQAYFLENE